MKGSAAIAEILRQEGSEYLFCFPYSPLIDPCVASGLRPILARTERTLVNMADGYTRLSNGRRHGVVVVQYGPGSENAFAGVAQAYADAVPILLLPGQVPQHRLGVPPLFDAVRAYAAVTKWAERINRADRIPEFLRRAFTLLRTGRPGPVLLEVPHDVAAADLDDQTVAAYCRGLRARSAADPEAVRQAARQILTARQPLLWVGQGVFYAEATSELRTLAELLEAPVMTTLNGKSAFPENHPLALGTGAYSGTPMVAHFLRACDLVVAVGSSLTRSNFAPPIPPGKTIIQITSDERDLSKDYPVHLGLLGDAKLVLGQLLEELQRQLGPQGRQGDGTVRQTIRQLKEAWLSEWMPRLTADTTPINPYRVIWELRQTLDPTRTIITHDSGNPRDQLVPFYEAVVPHGYIGWGHSTQLGTSLGLAMGAKLAAPEKLVVTVMGDTAFGMAGMDIETAVRERLPILVVILNNGAMGGYEMYMPLATERYRSKYLSGDYAQVARGLGAYSERVDQPAAIRPALQRAQQAIAEGRPAVLEMITAEDPSFPKYW